MTQPVTINVGQPTLASDFDAYENLTAAWPSWSPTLANLTLGNGAVIAKYRQTGKTVNYRFKFVCGSTSAVGSLPTFTLPVAPHGDFVFDDLIGFATFLNSGTQLYTGHMTYDGSSVARFKVSNTSSTYETTSDVTALIPFTWGVADTLVGWGTYYAA